MNRSKTPESRRRIGSPARRRTRAGSGLVALACLVVTIATISVSTSLATGFDFAYRSTKTPPVAVSTTGPTGPQLLGPACKDQPTSVVRSLPAVAVLDGSAVRLIEPRSCRVTTLIRRGASGPLSSSADGRWIGYGAAAVVNRTGTVVTMPLGLGIWVHGNRPTWAWSPHGDSMAGVTVQGGVVVGAPGRPARILLPDGWGATELAYAVNDTLIVVRGRSLWSVDVATGGAAQAYQSPNPEAALSIAQAAPGWVVFWEQPLVSASAAKDGAPLLAIDLTGVPTAHRLNEATVVDPAAVVRCGDGVLIMAGAGRDTTTGKTIELMAAHRWQRRSLGRGTSPTCAVGGRAVAFAHGAQEQPMGREQRHIVLIRRTGSKRHALRLGNTRALDTTDEAPLLGRTPDALLCVATRPATFDQNPPNVVETFQGTLTAIVVGNPAGKPIPLTTIGSATNYYGSYSWRDQITIVAD